MLWDPAISVIKTISLDNKNVGGKVFCGYPQVPGPSAGLGALTLSANFPPRHNLVTAAKATIKVDENLQTLLEAANMVLYLHVGSSVLAAF